MGIELEPYANAYQVETLADWIRSEVFTPLPDDWLIFVADVEGSTQAIARGEYKHVNALGTSCIVAATNACGQDAIPFVFGGDGAVLAAPPQYEAAVSAAWCGLQVRARQSVQLELRVGCISVREIRAQGADILVARRSMPGGFELALFSGGGVSLADECVKRDPARYALRAELPPEVSVEGLECRWNNVPTSHGRVMSLLVQVKDHDLNALAPLLQYLETILPQANPVRAQNLPLSWPPRHLGVELALRLGGGLRRWLSHAGLWLLTGIFSGIVKRQAHDPGTRAGAYVAGLVQNTDHLKLDDMFRAVLDVTPAQAQAIEDLLAAQEAQGRLAYGVFYSDHTLMTCFVRSLDNHVHFVDGGDGGYALAARQLKGKLKDRQNGK